MPLLCRILTKVSLMEQVSLLELELDSVQDSVQSVLDSVQEYILPRLSI